MADPQSSVHYQGTSPVSQKRTAGDAVTASGSARPSTVAGAAVPAAFAKRQCRTCTCSGQQCYCGAAAAAAAVAAAAALSRDQQQHGGPAQSVRPEAKRCGGGSAHPAASSPPANRSLVTAPVVNSCRPPGMSAQYAVSSASTVSAQPMYAGNRPQPRYQHPTISAQLQHRLPQSGSGGGSSSGTASHLRASPRSSAAVPPAAVSASATEIMYGLMRSAVATSAVTTSTMPSPSSLSGSTRPVSARSPRPASNVDVYAGQTASLPLAVVWPPTANGSASSVPGAIVHYVPGSLGDVRQQASSSATNRLIAERRLFRCTECNYFTTQQPKMMVHTDFYHPGSVRAGGPLTVRTAGVGQSAAAVAAVNGSIGCGVQSSPPAAMPAGDAAARSLSMSTLAGRASHAPDRRSDAVFRSSVAPPRGACEAPPLRAAPIRSESESPGAAQQSCTGQIWWPPSSKPSSVPAGVSHQDSTRPATGTLSCPLCSFKATLANLLQLHMVSRHKDQLQELPTFQRSLSLPGQHMALVADAKATNAAVPQAASSKIADNKRGRTEDADHDDPDVVITSWTIGPAASAVQSSRVPPAPCWPTPAVPPVHAVVPAVPPIPAVVPALASPAVPPVESAASAPGAVLSRIAATAETTASAFALSVPTIGLAPANVPEMLALRSDGPVSSGIGPTPLGCGLPLSSPPPLLLQSPASVAPDGGERTQLSSGDWQPQSERLLMLPHIQMCLQSASGAVDLGSPSVPVATNIPAESAVSPAEQLPAVVVSEASASVDDIAASASAIPLSTRPATEPSPPPCPAAVHVQPNESVVAADRPLHVLTEPVATSGESHNSGTTFFTWEDLVSFTLNCSSLDERMSASSPAPAPSAVSSNGSAATEMQFKVERPSSREGPSHLSYSWSERVLLGDLPFDEYDDVASDATSRPLPESEEQNKNSLEDAGGATATCRPQSESGDQLWRDFDQKKLQATGVAGESGPASTSAGSPNILLDAGKGWPSGDAPAVPACDEAALARAGIRDAPSASGCCDAGSVFQPEPYARCEDAEPASVEKRTCDVLDVTLQEKPEFVAGLGQPIAVANDESPVTAAPFSSLGESPLTSGAIPSSVTSVEEQSMYPPNGPNLGFAEEETKLMISNISSAKSDVNNCDSNCKDPDDCGRAAVPQMAGMPPVSNADGKQSSAAATKPSQQVSLMKQEHETEAPVSSAITGHSHDVMPVGDPDRHQGNNSSECAKDAPSKSADEYCPSGVEPFTHNDKSLPADAVGHSGGDGEKETAVSSPGPAVATRQRHLQQQQQQQQQLTNCGSSSSPSSGSRERPAKRRSCLLAIDRVRASSACSKHKKPRSTSGRAVVGEARSASAGGAAAKLRRLVKHRQPRCSCCASPAASSSSGSRAAAAARLASAKKRQCSKRHAAARGRHSV